jgi:hypothetical protein
MHSRLHKRFAGLAAAVAVAVPLSLGVAPVAHAAPAPDIKVTQNSSDTIVDGDGISCNDNTTGFASDNQFYRRFDLGKYGAANGFSVTKMTAAVEVGDATNGSVPGHFVVYAMDHSVGADFTIANLGAPLATVPVNLFTATGDVLISAPVSATVPAGKDMVIEVSVDAAATDQVFYPGANEAAESGTTYLSSAGCGIDEPTALGDVGPFGGISDIFWVNGKTTDCKNAETAAANAATAAAAASAKVTTATKKVKHAKKSLKNAKKSHDANKLQHAKAKLKKAKKKLKKANAASTAANAALATATATQGTKCAQPALPPAPARPSQGSHPSTGATNGHSFSTSRS